VEATNAIDIVKAALADAKSSGGATVSIDGLDKLLDDIRANATPSMEHYKLKYQGALAEYDVKNKYRLEMLKATIDAGREALNAIVLINGGAVIALLGFLGAVISKQFPASLGLRLTTPLLQFGLGVLLGALGFGARYLSQACYAGAKDRAGQILTLLAIIVVLAAYGIFGMGIYGAYQSFRILFAL
jgi:hypothetical protein